MSTKTTFKRIALVTVAALGFGVLSVAPSNAAVTAHNKASGMYDVTNSVAIVGAQAKVVFDLETSTINTFSWSGVGSVLSATPGQGANTYSRGPGRTGTATIAAYSSGYNTNGATPAYNPTSGTLVALGDTTAGGTVELLLTSGAVGTMTITCTESTTAGVVSTPVTKTITWVAGSYTANAGYSTSYIGTASASVAVDATAAAAFKPYAAKTAGTVGAQISTNIKSDVNAALVGSSITYSITSGPGTLSAISVGDDSTNDSTSVGRTLSKTATDMASASSAGVSVIADGSAGTTTITVTAGTTLLATHTLYFVGAAATYTPLVAKNTLRVGSNVGATYTVGSSDYVVRVKAVDSNGNRVVDGSTIYAVSSNPLVAAIAASATTTSGYAYFDVTGVIAGEGVKFTFRNASTAAASTVTVDSTAVNVTSNSIATLSMKFDKTSYEPGEKMTLTITALNAAGKPVADYGTSATGDNLYTDVFYAAGTANVALNGFSMPTTLETYDGVAEYTMYAPLISGTVTVTSGAMVFSSTAAQYLSKLTASATVASTAPNPTLDAATAANDAAAEATDAANAATDAANAAAEAADAATAAAQDAADAVAALSAQVATLISGLKAQLTALTNLVIKIQKKVKA